MIVRLIFLFSEPPQRLQKIDSLYQQFVIVGCPLEVAVIVKTLGVYLDSNLSMQAQVTQLKSSCAFICKLLRKIRPFLSEENLAHLGRALVLSRLDYCNSLLVGTSKANLHDLQVVQNRAVRAIKCLGRSDHVSQHRRDLHWLPVEHRINHKVVSMVHKCRSGAAPSYLSDRLVAAPVAHQLRSSTEHRLFQPRFKLKSFGATTFEVAAPSLWNGLPKSVRALPSLSPFKAVKTEYFNLS